MKEIDSKELLVRTKNLVAQERQVTLALIEHLEEISRRMLYAELGYASLWDFATRELGLSEGAAQRRIQAMRLVRDVPEAKTALESGRLSLSNAAKLQSFRQAEKKQGRRPDPKQLIREVSSLSQRECERVLLSISPQSVPRESERIVSENGDHELKLVISAALHEKLQRLKGLLAHTLPDASMSEILDYLTSEVLGRLEKKKGIRDEEISTAAAAVNENGSTVTGPGSVVSESESVSGALGELPLNLPSGRRVHLPAALRRAVWARGGGRCQISIQGRRCESRFRLEVDHIQPLAQGGSHELSNLRLACWHHNQQQALEKLGRWKGVRQA